MPLVESQGDGVAVLSSGQTGNGDSTNVAVRPVLKGYMPGGAVVIANTAGATPTVTINIQGSVDGVNFFNVPYALVGTPRTFVVSAITLTTTATNTYLLQEGVYWRFLKLVYSANTNETLTASAYL